MCAADRLSPRNASRGGSHRQPRLPSHSESGVEKIQVCLTAEPQTGRAVVVEDVRLLKPTVMHDDPHPLIPDLHACDVCGDRHITHGEGYAPNPRQVNGRM